MATWLEPVTNRTILDVLDAKRNQTGQLGKKGALDYPDLNRIENNYKFLIGLLSAEGYYYQPEYRNVTESWTVNSSTITKTYTDWQKDNILFKSEVDRIRSNINKLGLVYLNGSIYPFEYSPFLEYNEVNLWESVEKNTLDSYNKMVENYVRCGTQTCGGVNL